MFGRAWPLAVRAPVKFDWPVRPFGRSADGVATAGQVSAWWMRMVVALAGRAARMKGGMVAWVA
jgi:hypothetical protein